MPDDLITIQADPVEADLVDDTLWFETPQTRTATAALWRILAIARGEPMPWMPLVALVGPSGVGKTALAARFVRAAQRSVACDLGGGTDGSFQHGTDALTMRMTRTSRGCPGHCRPALLTEEAELAQILGSVMNVQPATIVPMSREPHRDDDTMRASRVWRSPGNETNDPIRRTVMVFVDHADRLLALSPAQRRTALERMVDYNTIIGHRVMRVYIGSPALANALSEIGSTQTIALDAMPNDAAFSSVARQIFGPLTDGEIAALYDTTGGIMGQMLHLAAIRGLAPPYAVKDKDIRRLPAPAR